MLSVLLLYLFASYILFGGSIYQYLLSNMIEIIFESTVLSVLAPAVVSAPKYFILKKFHSTGVEVATHFSLIDTYLATAQNAVKIKISLER